MAGSSHLFGGECLFGGRWLVLLILIPLTGFGWMGGWVEHNNLFPAHLLGWWGFMVESAHCWVLRRQPLLV